MAARGSSAARRYARALFSLAREGGRVDEVRRELELLVELVEATPALRQVLARPLHPAARRRAVLLRIGELLTLSKLFCNFCSFLIDQRRMLELSAIRDAYARLADEAAGRSRAEVITAAPLGRAQLERLRRALAAHTGREVEISLHTDPGLIGGVVARVGDLLFDGSLRTQLAQVGASVAKE